MLWIANALIITALVSAGWKWRHSWLLSIAGELLYCSNSYRTGQWELLMLSTIFCLIALRNWYLWGKK